MRRLWIVLIAGAIAMIIAIPAGTAVPRCSDNPNHPRCIPDDSPEPPAEDPPMGGTMCDPAEYPDDVDGAPIVDVQTDDFNFILSGKQDSACIDVTTHVEGEWEVTIKGSGARYLGIIPRDSIASGDSCGGYLLRRYDAIYQSNPLFLGYTGVIPAATVNACGTDDGEWVDIALDGLEPSLVTDGGDCSVIDGDQCLVAGQLDVEHPLVLQAFLSGSADGVTKVYVDLPSLSD
jgi:hypothetical protein